MPLIKGKDFKVSKDVYDRAKERYDKAHPEGPETGRYYMLDEDKVRLFDDATRWGYGLYSCTVREENGEYICSYMTGDSCD